MSLVKRDVTLGLNLESVLMHRQSYICDLNLGIKVSFTCQFLVEWHNHLNEVQISINLNEILNTTFWISNHTISCKFQVAQLHDDLSLIKEELRLYALETSFSWFDSKRQFFNVGVDLSKVFIVRLNWMQMLKDNWEVFVQNVLNEVLMNSHFVMRLFGCGFAWEE